MDLETIFYHRCLQMSYLVVVVVGSSRRREEDPLQTQLAVCWRAECLLFSAAVQLLLLFFFCSRRDDYDILSGQSLMRTTGVTGNTCGQHRAAVCRNKRTPRIEKPTPVKSQKKALFHLKSSAGPRRLAVLHHHHHHRRAALSIMQPRTRTSIYQPPPAMQLLNNSRKVSVLGE